MNRSWLIIVENKYYKKRFFLNPYYINIVYFLSMQQNSTKNDKKHYHSISLPTKVCIVKAMVFPVIIYRCESWTIKKDEGRRIDTF